MADQKFEIEGEIEHDGPPKNRSRILWGRYFLFVLVVLVITGVFFFPYLQDAYPALRFGKKEPVPGTKDTVVYSAQSPAYMDSILTVNDSLKRATEMLLEASINYSTESSSNSTPAGRVYEIQIGAFKNFDLNKFRNGLVNLNGEEAGAFNKLTLGRFTDEATAKSFLKAVKEIGFKDAWIVARENGKRVPYEN